jgi:uncharacterized membrane protein YgdD (TMEM256/DUF423 family)
MKEITFSQKKWAAVGALMAMMSVMAGAFGAHLLEHKLPEGKLAVFNIAVRYQMYHALAILVVSFIEIRRSKIILWLFLIGIILFSGGLYAYSLSYLFYDYGYEFFGVFAPFGGLSFVSAWLILAWNLLSNKK